MSGVVLDAAGGNVGGAARWLAELDRYLESNPGAITVIGRSRRLTSTWIMRREPKARGAHMTVAANNVSFAMSGAHRRVLVRNALHFLYQDEADLLRTMPMRFRTQIPIVRKLLTRADLIVVPTSTMGDRVRHHIPSVRDRIVVRAHPVTAHGSRTRADRPFVLVPVLPASYKNLLPELEKLLDAITRAALDLRVKVTASPAQLPSALSEHPRLDTLGIVPHSALVKLWLSATAVFFPCTVESFGYPLAEARVHGIPVLSPDTALAREVAGRALLPYQLGDLDSLADALFRVDDPVSAEPAAFDAQEYFQWLFRPPGERLGGRA